MSQSPELGHCNEQRERHDQRGLREDDPSRFDRITFVGPAVEEVMWLSASDFRTPRSEEADLLMPIGRGAVGPDDRPLRTVCAAALTALEPQSTPGGTTTESPSCLTSRIADLDHEHRLGCTIDRVEGTGSAMRSFAQRHLYLIMPVGLLAFFLAMFLVTEELRVPVLTDPEPYLGPGFWLTGVLGIGLLMADVVLPVPSSGVMILQGAAYGLFWGSLLSLVGGTGATFTGFVVGRRSRQIVNRIAAPDERLRVLDLLDKYGIWAVVVTRPVPMLAETVAILAGAGRLSWWRVTVAGALGNVVPAVAYAAVGAYARSFVDGVVIFLLVLLLATVAWFLQLLYKRVARARRNTRS